MQQVAFLHHIHHVVGFARVGHHRHRLMSVRIEFFADRVDFPEARFFECRIDLLQSQFDSAFQAFQRDIFGR